MVERWVPPPTSTPRPALAGTLGSRSASPAMLPLIAGSATSSMHGTCPLCASAAELATVPLIHRDGCESVENVAPHRTDQALRHLTHKSDHYWPVGGGGVLGPAPRREARTRSTTTAVGTANAANTANRITSSLIWGSPSGGRARPAVSVDPVAGASVGVSGFELAEVELLPVGTKLIDCVSHFHHADHSPQPVPGFTSAPTNSRGDESVYAT